jgi:FkbM family methyltransferase
MIVELLNRLAENASDLKALASAKIPRKAKLSILAVYLRLFLKSRFDRFFHFSEERFLGYRVATGPYHHFALFFREIFVRHSYLFKATTNQPVILDCGSNIGLSVLYFKWLYPEATMIAFEPCPPIFELLKKNVEQNNLKNVTLVQAAIADQAGVLQLHFPSHKPMGGGATVVAEAAETKQEQLKREWQTVDVKTVPLSDYISGPVDLLKMDIEGAETLSFRDLEKSEKIQQINQGIIEFHYNEANEKNNFIELLTLLKRASFHTTPYQERELSDPSGQAVHKRGFHNFMLRISHLAK